jgi:hypothetical protein
MDVPLRVLDMCLAMRIGVSSQQYIDCTWPRPHNVEHLTPKLVTTLPEL